VNIIVSDQVSIPSHIGADSLLVVEMKSKSEIIDVQLYTVLASEGGQAVEAVVVTNLGRFVGCCGVSSEETLDLLEDFRDSILTVLSEVDPAHGAEIDRILVGVRSEAKHAPVLLALSIACRRAAARHRGLSVFKYISSEAGDAEMCIPMPLVTLASVVDESGQWVDLMGAPCQALSIADAIETIRKAALVSSEALSMNARRPSSSGALCVSAEVETAVHSVYQRLREADAAGSNVQLAIDVRSAVFSQSSLFSIWKDCALFSIEDASIDMIELGALSTVSSLLFK
jgi:enolase